MGIDTETTWVGFTPHGRRLGMVVRPGTSDWNTVNSCNAPNDEYHLPEGLSGWALDVGAHIGALTVPLLLDNPGLRVIAIEALPENVAVLHRNLVNNDVEDRCLLIHAAASDSAAPVAIGYGSILNDGNGEHTYIGNQNAPAGSRFVQLPGVTLRGAMLQRGMDQDKPFVWSKIDCEGCEYRFLASDWVGALAVIQGEVHFGSALLESLLKSTHVVTFPKFDENPDFGPFTAVAIGAGSDPVQ